MGDWVESLDEMLAAAGATVTFDAQRDITKPCIVCLEADLPRTLLVIGERTYPNGIKEPLRRPVCERCAASTKWGDVGGDRSSEESRDG